MEYIQYIKPELLILIPVLIAAGGFMKKSELVKDRYIPLILGICGMILSCLWVLGDSFDNNIFTAVFTAVIQGVLCAGSAVYGNQIYKQYGKDKGGD